MFETDIEEEPYEERHPKWLSRAQKPPTNLWAQHFTLPENKRNPLFIKLFSKELSIKKVFYPFLEKSQIYGKVYQSFGIPHICGEISKQFLLDCGKKLKCKLRRSKTKRNSKIRSAQLYSPQIEVKNEKQSLFESVKDSWKVEKLYDRVDDHQLYFSPYTSKPRQTTPKQSPVSRESSFGHDRKLYSSPYTSRPRQTTPKQSPVSRESSFGHDRKLYSSPYTSRPRQTTPKQSSVSRESSFGHDRKHLLDQFLIFEGDIDVRGASVKQELLSSEKNVTVPKENQGFGSRSNLKLVQLENSKSKLNKNVNTASSSKKSSLRLFSSNEKSCIKKRVQFTDIDEFRSAESDNGYDESGDELAKPLRYCEPKTRSLAAEVTKHVEPSIKPKESSLIPARVHNNIDHQSLKAANTITVQALVHCVDVNDNGVDIRKPVSILKQNVNSLNISSDDLENVECIQEYKESGYDADLEEASTQSISDNENNADLNTCIHKFSTKTLKSDSIEIENLLPDMNCVNKSELNKDIGCDVKKENIVFKTNENIINQISSQTSERGSRMSKLFTSDKNLEAVLNVDSFSEDSTTENLVKNNENLNDHTLEKIKDFLAVDKKSNKNIYEVLSSASNYEREFDISAELFSNIGPGITGNANLVSEVDQNSLNSEMSCEEIQTSQPIILPKNYVSGMKVSPAVEIPNEVDYVSLPLNDQIEKSDTINLIHENSVDNSVSRKEIKLFDSNKENRNIEYVATTLPRGNVRRTLNFDLYSDSSLCSVDIKQSQSKIFVEHESDSDDFSFVANLSQSSLDEIDLDFRRKTDGFQQNEELKIRSTMNNVSESNDDIGNVIFQLPNRSVSSSSEMFDVTENQKKRTDVKSSFDQDLTNSSLLANRQSSEKEQVEVENIQHLSIETCTTKEIEDVSERVSFSSYKNEVSFPNLLSQNDSPKILHQIPSNHILAESLSGNVTKIAERTDNSNLESKKSDLPSETCSDKIPLEKIAQLMDSGNENLPTLSNYGKSLQESTCDLKINPVLEMNHSVMNDQNVFGANDQNSEDSDDILPSSQTISQSLMTHESTLSSLKHTLLKKRTTCANGRDVSVGGKSSTTQEMNKTILSNDKILSKSLKSDKSTDETNSDDIIIPSQLIDKPILSDGIVSDTDSKTISDNVIMPAQAVDKEISVQTTPIDDVGDSFNDNLCGNVFDSVHASGDTVGVVRSNKNSEEVFPSLEPVLASMFKTTQPPLLGKINNKNEPEVELNDVKISTVKPISSVTKSGESGTGYEKKELESNVVNSKKTASFTAESRNTLNESSSATVSGKNVSVTNKMMISRNDSTSLSQNIVTDPINSNYGTSVLILSCTSTLSRSNDNFMNKPKDFGTLRSDKEETDKISEEHVQKSSQSTLIAESSQIVMRKQLENSYEKQLESDVSKPMNRVVATDPEVVSKSSSNSGNLPVTEIKVSVTNKMLITSTKGNTVSSLSQNFVTSADNLSCKNSLSVASNKSATSKSTPSCMSTDKSKESAIRNLKIIEEELADSKPKSGSLSSIENENDELKQTNLLNSEYLETELNIPECNILRDVTNVSGEPSQGTSKSSCEENILKIQQSDIQKERGFVKSGIDGPLEPIKEKEENSKNNRNNWVHEAVFDVNDNPTRLSVLQSSNQGKKNDNPLLNVFLEDASYYNQIHAGRKSSLVDDIDHLYNSNEYNFYGEKENSCVQDEEELPDKNFLKKIDESGRTVWVKEAVIDPNVKIFNKSKSDDRNSNLLLDIIFEGSALSGGLSSDETEHFTISSEAKRNDVEESVANLTKEKHVTLSMDVRKNNRGVSDSSRWVKEAIIDPVNTTTSICTGNKKSSKNTCLLDLIKEDNFPYKTKQNKSNKKNITCVLDRPSETVRAPSILQKQRVVSAVKDLSSENSMKNIKLPSSNVEAKKKVKLLKRKSSEENTAPLKECVFDKKKKSPIAKLKVKDEKSNVGNYCKKNSGALNKNTKTQKNITPLRSNTGTVMKIKSDRLLMSSGEDAASKKNVQPVKKLSGPVLTKNLSSDRVISPGIFYSTVPDGSQTKISTSPEVPISPHIYHYKSIVQNEDHSFTSIKGFNFENVSKELSDEELSKYLSPEEEKLSELDNDEGKLFDVGVVENDKIKEDLSILSQNNSMFGREKRQIPSIQDILLTSDDSPSSSQMSNDKRVEELKKASVINPTTSIKKSTEDSYDSNLDKSILNDSNKSQNSSLIQLKEDDKCVKWIKDSQLSKYNVFNKNSADVKRSKTDEVLQQNNSFTNQLTGTVKRLTAPIMSLFSKKTENEPSVKSNSKKRSATSAPYSNRDELFKRYKVDLDLDECSPSDPSMKFDFSRDEEDNSISEENDSSSEKSQNMSDLMMSPKSPDLILSVCSSSNSSKDDERNMEDDARSLSPIDKWMIPDDTSPPDFQPDDYYD